MEFTAYYPPGPGLTKLLRVMTSNCLQAVRSHRTKIKAIFLAMKLTTILLLITFMQVSARTYSQRISLSVKNAPIESVFKEIKKQTGYQFLFNNQMLDDAKSVTIEIDNGTLEQALEQCFKEQSLSYTIVEKTIVIKQKIVSANQVLKSFFPPPPIDVKGKVLNENDEPVAGVTVTVKGTKNATSTDVNGFFEIKNIDENATLVFTSVNMETYEIKVNGKTELAINLKTKTSKLDEVQVIAYGTSTQRLNTGSVSTVKSVAISNQPVSNPVAALQGRVSGLMISSSSGLPGADIQVRVRGENSMKQGNDPLYIIDGVPFFSAALNQFQGGNGSQSPLNSLNPGDIERIDILKDADATAIYGSRGANGVILITTKKGKAGQSQVNVNVYSGISKTSRMMDLLNTQQYLELRKDAFAQDGVTPTASNAPDLLVWDQNAYTDWQKLLIGNTANVLEAQVSFSGGTALTRFLLSGTYRHETTVLPGDFSFNKGGILLKADHNSSNGKLGITASFNYNADKNRIFPTDVTQYFTLAPNYAPYNPDGSFQWFGNVQNPLAILKRTYETKTNNLIGNSVLRYNLTSKLTLRTNLGLTQTNMNQLQTLPFVGFNPATAPASQSQFGDVSVRSYIVEPQAEYTTRAGAGKLNLLAGTSWQQNVNEGNFLFATGFSSDALLKDIRSASTVTVRNNDYRQYNYQSVFGRVNYNLSQTYLLNLTFRRDGSSRFGPGKRFGNFGAIGAGWILTNESFAKGLSFLSYAKLRGSYGTTGNDQIGDYQYLDTWGSSSFPYGGLTGLSPTRVFNADYSWEVNKKMEAALELGFVQNRILFTTNYYNNRSSNQLIGRTLSAQSGFSSYIANLPAKVENSGWEFDLNTVNIKGKALTWETSFNLTIPSNKLLEYPNLESSADANSYEVGQSIRMIKGFQFTGVNTATGIPEFLDVNKDGFITSPADYVVLGETMPTFYGGLSNTLSYKGLSLDVFFQFVKQESITLDWGPTTATYGSMNNKNVSALDRWQKPGDITDIPRATTTTANAANVAFRNFYRSSSAAWGDASYIRLKNVALSYDLSSVFRKIKLNGGSIYLLGQNLWTITNYKGLDPEINGFDRRFVFPINPFGSVKTQALPVLRTITLGIKLSL